ncbi:hypothetical protein [Aquimarina algicola]|uniref:Secreted protein n=1 Tax=Aquimarina algicola TaxID=2589995 RepID=A0A504JDS0_9FLAO|nr:hypothetical protein [Aquimarina algicola]TPN88967.1 hypothetical protein FHK87_01745 [Aquimarina algicola]
MLLISKKIVFFSISLLFSIWISHAQIEKSTSLRIDAESNLNTDKYSISGATLNSNLNADLPSISEPADLSKYGRQPKAFSMIDDNGLLQPHAKDTPKWFEKDKAFEEKFKSDQYFGDFKSGGSVVKLIYRDHQFVDGDIVRISVNDEVILSKVFLSSQFQGIEIDLIKGFNKIDITALNQGDSGPNTAAFQLYDEYGNLMTSNEWNLATGVKASMIVVKE